MFQVGQLIRVTDKSDRMYNQVGTVIRKGITVEGKTIYYVRFKNSNECSRFYLSQIKKINN